MSDPKRKLTFERHKGLGKLKLRFEDGTLTIRLAKQRAGYALTREEAQELALWLSSWSLRLIEADARTDENAAPQADGQETKDGKPKKGKRSKNAKKSKSKRKNGASTEGASVSLADKPLQTADGQTSN